MTFLRELQKKTTQDYPDGSWHREGIQNAVAAITIVVIFIIHMTFLAYGKSSTLQKLLKHFLW